MPIKTFFKAILLAAVSVFAAVQDLPTPYDLIRPVWPLTWDEAIFDQFDTTVSVKHNMVPKNRTPAAYKPNEFIPDSLNQAYLDNINAHISPIRINQAGYLNKDPEKQFYYVGDAITFEVVDINGKSLSPAVTGTLTSSGHQTSSIWQVVAGTNAATNYQKRYDITVSGPSGTIMIGNIPNGLENEVRYRIKVGNDISSTFIISDRVYSMVSAALIKFYGVQRSGNGDSWFHPASHMLDGGGVEVDRDDDLPIGFNASMAGTLEGGYYDCGDHIKESITQMFSTMVVALLHSTNPDVDEDNYDFNHNETVQTDGIPDMLRESRHGAEFVLRAYRRANGIVDDMALSIGNKDIDHQWWGRPEYHDNLPKTPEEAINEDSYVARGGPATRNVRLGEMGASVGGVTAAALALIGKDYAEFDQEFADSCLMVAKEIYDMSRSVATGKGTYGNGKTIKHNTKATFNSKANQGNNEFFDDMALASVALLYATGEKQYADDALRSKDFSTPTQQGAGFFDGGWFSASPGALGTAQKEKKNSGWNSVAMYAVYALYKLILADKEKAISIYGLTETEWLNAVEDCIANMINNVADVSSEDGAVQKESITLPQTGIQWKNSTVSYSRMWYTMFTVDEWIYNRYLMGDAFDVMAYADVANDIQTKNISLPNMGTPDWKAAEMYQLGINMFNYQLGMNPWDFSSVYGVGDKNDAHPHHRAANPEGKNVPGAAYSYRPPVGAVYGGIAPDINNGNQELNALRPDRASGQNISWEDWYKEICIYSTANFLSATALASQKIDKGQAPDITVEIRHVSMDSAIVAIRLTKRGTLDLLYGPDGQSMSQKATSTETGVAHEIILRDLTPGTLYNFYVIGYNAYKPENFTEKYMVDSTKTPFSFTTLNMIESADIQNVTVCNLTADTAEIMWYTPNGEYDSKIYWDTIPHATANEYAFNSGKGNADVSGIPTKFHYVKIGGLKEQTTYYYMVESNGIFRNVDDNGAQLKFKTPVTWYDFSVRAYQYIDNGLDALDVNVYNNEARPFDYLTLRFYFTARPDQVEQCATLVDSDICQAYDEAGFNHACPTDREIRDSLRAALPVRLEDTYNPADGTYSYYFPVNLGSTIIKSGSRLRFDLDFSSGISNDGYKTCETLRQPGKKRFSKNSGDWSWKPHDYLTDGADYEGMPVEDKDYGDIDTDVPIDPYITVYRKDEFIWGYSPSHQEMTTKRAHYQIETTFDPPFDVSNGSYVQVDQTSSTFYVTGHAKITENGNITKIWVNGQLVTDMPIIFGSDKVVSSLDGSVIVAQYNKELDIWDLKIPVKMSVGSNKVDITVFAGADPSCWECSENGGCAFENRNYYVQFTRGNLTPSALTIKDAAGNPIASPATPGSTNFNVFVRDIDKAKYVGTIYAYAINTKKNDTLKILLEADADNPGNFHSKNTIAAVSKTKENRNAATEISFFPGDTIQVIYIDPDDEEDISKQSFFSESHSPVPQKVLAQDANCDGAPDQLLVIFSSALEDAFAFDSIRFYIEGMPDTATVKLSPADYVGKSEVTVSLGGIPVPVTTAPTGKAVLSITSEGVTNYENISITDGILPTLTSVTILENPNHESELDTVMIAFSEPVIIANEAAWPITANGDAGTIAVVGKPTTLNDGLSWQYTISGNDKGRVIPVGGTAMVAADAIITDKALNALIPGGGCKPSVTIAETPKPVPVTLAQIRDIEGDGYPDEIYIKFKKHIRPKDMLDSFVVDWGRPSIVKSFIMSFDSSSGNVVPKDDFWTLKDSIAEPRTVNITADSTAIVIDTVSILTITIPTSLSYPLGTTSGAYESESGFFGSIVPRLGPAGGFFDKSYPLVDFCPPIVMKAVKETANDFSKLTVTFSEPLTDIGTETLHYIERKRGSSEGVFLFPKSATHTDSKTTFLYSDESDDAINIGDFVRLDTNAPTSRFKDKASNFPTRYNPWVKVSGSSAEKTRFKVSMEQAVTQVKQGQAFYTPETQPTDKEVFRLTVVGNNGKESIVDGNTIGVPLDATYTHGGPVFQLDISMAAAMMGGKTQKYLYDMMLSIEMNLYDNLGQFIANKTFKMDFAENTQWRDAISEDGILHLNLEWVAHDGTAPVSDKGRKLGTGAYISKFDFTAVKTCTEDVNEEEEGGIKCKIGQKDKTTDNTTKTFGFKRSKGK